MEKYSINIFCPNCGAKIREYKRQDGTMKTYCPRCSTKIFSKQKSKQEIYLKLKFVT